ncbi:MAG: hypothetical protein R2939_03325 [Kofleriaceae bacterium]
MDRRACVLLLGLLACPRGARARPAPELDAPWSAEVSVGYGAAIGGGAGALAVRPSPLVLTLGGAAAIRAEPAVAAHGALVLETLDRGAVGAMAGVRLPRLAGGLRLGVDAIAMMAPYTLVGLALRAGRCVALSPGMRMCPEVGLTSFVEGSDLAPGQVSSQLLLLVGVELDAR